MNRKIFPELLDALMCAEPQTKCKRRCGTVGRLAHRREVRPDS
jgi:hypothetical protein